MPPGFDRLESFGHDELTAKQGAQGLLMLMGSKFLIKMTRPQNTVLYLNGLRPGHLYQTILIPSTSGGFEHLK